MMFCFVPGATLTFQYNYKGETEVRHVKFVYVAVGALGNVFPEETIFLHCTDYDRDGAPRSFAVNRIVPGSIAVWNPPLTQPVNPDGDKAD